MTCPFNLFLFLFIIPSHLFNFPIVRFNPDFFIWLIYSFLPPVLSSGRSFAAIFFCSLPNHLQLSDIFKGTCDRHGRKQIVLSLISVTPHTHISLFQKLKPHQIHLIIYTNLTFLTPR